MKKNLIAVVNNKIEGYYSTINEIIKEFDSWVFYGANVIVYQIDKNCKPVPYYLGDFSLSINRSNIEEIKKQFNYKD